MGQTQLGNGDRDSQRIIAGSLVFLALAAGAMILRYTQSIMIPFVGAVFIAVLASALLDVLVLRVHLPRTVAFLVAVLVVLIVLGALCLFAIQGIQSIVSAAWEYQESSVRLMDPNALGGVVNVEGGVATDAGAVGAADAEGDGEAVAEGAGAGEAQGGVDADAAGGVDIKTDGDVDVEGDVGADGKRVWFAKKMAWLEKVKEVYGVDLRKIAQGMLEKVPRLVANTFGTAVSFVTGIFLTTIFVLFLLAGRNPHAIHRGVFADVDSQIRRYIATKVALSGATGLLVWGALAIMKLKLAGVFGMLAFMLNFIPSIGSIIATLLPIPIAIAQYQSLGPVMLVVLIPGAIQMTIGNFIEPKLMGKGLNLHPVTILLALAFWGLLWGVVGMFLAVPVTAIIRIIFMQSETLRPVGDLLAGRLPEQAATKGR